MSRKPIKVEVIDESGESFIVRTFSDGTKEQHHIVKLPRKKRYPPRPYQKRDLNRTRKKGI